MHETTTGQTEVATKHTSAVPPELAAVFDVIRKRSAPFAAEGHLVGRGEQVATLDMTGAVRNIIAEIERYPEIAKGLAGFGFPEAERARVSEAATQLELAFHRSEGTTVDVTAAAAKVDDLVAQAKLCRAELATISENALPPVLADSVRRASTPTSGRPIEIAKALSGIVAAVREVPASWDGPDGKVDIAERLAAFGLVGERLVRAGEVAEALQKAASVRDRARVEAQGQASGPWDIYDGILWEAGKAMARGATTAARAVGRSDVTFSITNEVRRIARVRKLKANPAAPAVGASGTVPTASGTVPGASGPR